MGGVDIRLKVLYTIIMIKKVFIVVLALYFLTGCSKPPSDKKDVLARIDNYSVYTEDFVDEMSTISDFQRAGKTNEELLQEVIQKKLLLMEAEREGLDKKAPFMKMVERFWEQSLLRSLVEKKMNEFFTATYASDDEIKARVAQTGQKIEAARKVIIREKVNKKFVEWMDGLKAKAKISIDKRALDKVSIKPKE